MPNCRFVYVYLSATVSTVTYLDLKAIQLCAMSHSQGEARAAAPTASVPSPSLSTHVLSASASATQALSPSASDPTRWTQTWAFLRAMRWHYPFWTQSSCFAAAWAPLKSATSEDIHPQHFSTTASALSILNGRMLSRSARPHAAFVNPAT